MSEKWTDRILIQNLKLDMSIGIYEKERIEKQPVLLSVLLEVKTNKGKVLNNIHEVVSYEKIVRDIQKLANSCHYNLIERFAEDIAENCLNNSMIEKIDITAIKTQVMPETTGVGVSISRRRLS